MIYVLPCVNLAQALFLVMHSPVITRERGVNRRVAARPAGRSRPGEGDYLALVPLAMKALPPRRSSTKSGPRRASRASQGRSESLVMMLPSA